MLCVASDVTTGMKRKERRVLKMHVASISRDIPFLKGNKKLACGYIGVMEKLNNFVFELKKNAHPFKCSSLFLSFRAKQKNKKDKNKIK